MKKVTGLGGIFFKSKDPAGTRGWYEKHLGFKTDEYGGVFEWRKLDDSQHRAYTAWTPFEEETDYFKPSEKEFMINLRVADLPALLDQLRAEGIEVVGEIQEFDYGKFAHIMDPNGIKIELWQPVDQVFTKVYDGKSIH